MANFNLPPELVPQGVVPFDSRYFPHDGPEAGGGDVASVPCPWTLEQTRRLVRSCFIHPAAPATDTNPNVFHELYIIHSYRSDIQFGTRHHLYTYTANGFRLYAPIVRQTLIDALKAELPGVRVVEDPGRNPQGHGFYYYPPSGGTYRVHLKPEKICVMVLTGYNGPVDHSGGDTAGKMTPKKDGKESVVDLTRAAPPPARSTESHSATETYKMVYQGTGEHFSDEDNVGSFGAAGGCTIVAILTPEGNYIAHVDATTQQLNPDVFAKIRRYSGMKDAKVFLTKNSESQKTGEEIMTLIPKDKEVTFGEGASSLKVDRGTVTFNVAPTKEVDSEVMEETEKMLLHLANESEKLFEEKGGFEKRPEAPGRDYYFSARLWDWVRR